MDSPVLGRHACRLASLLALILCSTCAFDIVSVKQLPVTLTAPIGVNGFMLDAAAEVHIGTGFLVRLKPGTAWRSIGTTEFGEAYTTPDQVLVVEASNIHEAALVVKDDVVSGFYLLLEKKFCPATKPVKLVLTPR